MVRVGAGIGVTGGSVAGNVTRRITVGGIAATIVTVVTAAAARLRVVIIVAARAAGATRRTFVVVNIVITSVSGIVRIHSGGQYRFLEEQGRHRLAATHGLVARGQGFDRVEQALIRGVLVRIRNCTARTTANRTVLVIIIHIHRRTGESGSEPADPRSHHRRTGGSESGGEPGGPRRNRHRPQPNGGGNVGRHRHRNHRH